MSARPSFGVVIPATGPFGSQGVFGAVVDAIEDLGYDDVWFGDHVAVPSYAAHITAPDWLEPITCCLLALGRTTRLRAGTDVLVLPYRNPLLVAKMAATADVMSNGRVVLGVGVGYLKGGFAWVRLRLRGGSRSGWEETPLRRGAGLLRSATGGTRCSPRLRSTGAATTRSSGCERRQSS